MNRTRHENCFRISIRVVGVALLLAFQASMAFAWGEIGHEIVSMFAENRLSSKARVAVKQLLGTENMKQVGGWADRVKDRFPETKVHYIVITKTKNGTKVSLKAAPGPNVASSIDEFVGIVSDLNRSLEDRRNALKFLIHFVGDVHCPIHCTPGNDRGGTQRRVRYFGEDSNLHRVWDGGLIRSAKVSRETYVKGLEKILSQMDVEKMRNGKPLGWAFESYRVCVQNVYSLPSDDVLNERYYEASIRAVNIQLIRAGVRLADMLNEIFEKLGNSPHS